MKAELGERAGLESEKTRDSRLSFREIVGIGSKRFVRFGAAALLLASTLLSPIDAPVRNANAESNPQQANSLTLLHGNDSERRVRLNILLLPQNGTTTQMLQDVAEDIFRIPPTNEFKDRVNVYKKNPEEDLRCDQNAICDWDAVNREIDRIAAEGIIPHETMMVVKSNEQLRGAGWGLFESSSTPPSLYTASAVVRPVSISPNFREFYASAIAHELWGHAYAGFDHEGGDLMDNSAPGGLARQRFNPPPPNS